MLPFKQGAIKEWRKFVLESDRMCQVLQDIDRWPYTILPCKPDIFNAFRMLYPHEVRVVMVAQSPYPGYCPATQIPYACAAALSKPPRDVLFSWVEQGILLLNASLTVGKNCPKYLEDHSVLWEEVMRDILSRISYEFDPIFVLIGKDAWKFESCVQTVMKVSHPPWKGVFSDVCNLMIEKGEMPIIF